MAEADPLAGDAQVRDIQGRLQQMGATYYVLELLEAWKQQPQAYRFYCTVAADRDSGQAQGFEAMAAEPRQAMAEVLRQVERWRGGSRARQFFLAAAGAVILSAAKESSKHRHFSQDSSLRSE